MYERTNYAWEKCLVYSHDMLSDSDKIPLPWPLKIINVIRTATKLYSNQTVLALVDMSRKAAESLSWN